MRVQKPCYLFAGSKWTVLSKSRHASLPPRPIRRARRPTITRCEPICTDLCSIDSVVLYNVILWL